MRIAVIGGGLVGLATAHKLQQARPGAEVVVLEKEAGFGRHQSTHNSGVLHAGLYYRPGSLKARLAVGGIRELTTFCREHGVAHEICGKVVVATRADELPRLRALHERAQANGLRGVRWLDAGELREREPHAAGEAALLVPEEGIVDYAAVVARLAERIGAAGGELLTGARVVELGRAGGRWRVGV